MPAPVGYTCPDINKLIKAIKSAQKTACRGEELENESTKLFTDILDHLYGLEDELEQLRKDNAALREWGYSLERELESIETSH